MVTNETRERVRALLSTCVSEVLAAIDGSPGTAPAPPPSNVVPVMRFGRCKGVPLSQATEADLEWYAAAIAKSIADPSKAQYRDDNERQLDAVRVERERRAMQPGEAPGRPLAADDDQIPF